MFAVGFNSSVRTSVLTLGMFATVLTGQMATAQETSIGGGAGIGQLNRHSSSFLGTELGGMISAQLLVDFGNDATVESYTGDFAFDTTNLTNQLFGDWFQFDPGVRFTSGLSFEYTQSDANGQTDFLPTGTASGLIFSPQGLSGGLGGGLNIGNRDFQNLLYANDYEYAEIDYFKKAFFDRGPATIKPSLLFGYGRFDITESLTGQVAGINEDFAYHNQIDVDSFIIGAGVDIGFPVGQVGNIPVEYYGGIWGQARFHNQSGQSTLILNGLVNAEETELLGGSETTGAIQAYAGLSFEFTDQWELLLGGKARYFQSPGVVILPQQPARIQWNGATEWLVFAEITYEFGVDTSDQGEVFSSDRRLKRDIAHVATLANGIRLYRFRYVWDDQVHVGVMAQDLLADEAFRDAVVKTRDGYYGVNYAKLGLKMATLEAWNDNGPAAVAKEMTTARLPAL